MINETIWQELAKRTGLEAEQLRSVITSEKEETIELTPVNILTDAQLNELKETVGKESAKTGAKTIIEMDVKALREKHGLEFEGKTIENLLSAYANKQIADAKIEPNKKVDELKASLENLQKQYETDLGLKSNEVQTLGKKLSEYKVNGDLAKHMPEGLTGIEQNDFLTIAKTAVSFDYEDGELVVKRGDIILKDKMEKPISPKDYLTEFAMNKKWIGSDGRSGGDEGGNNSGAFQSVTDIYRHMDNNKIDPLSVQGQKLITDFNNEQNK